LHQITEYQFALPIMKKMFILSMLIALAMICACQKQDATVEEQIAQRKVELDSREQALDEREKALERREQAVADKEKVMADGRVIQPRRPVHHSAEAEADRQRRIQQLPPELRALIPDRSKLDAGKAEKDGATQGGMGQSQSNVQRKFEAMQKQQIPDAAAPPAAQTTSSPSSAVEDGSVIPSPTPE
jgi:hypothetical protein